MARKSKPLKVRTTIAFNAAQLDWLRATFANVSEAVDELVRLYRETGDVRALNARRLARD